MLLAVDTSTRLIGVALYDGVSVLSEASWVSRNHHTVELAPAVADAISRIGAHQDEIKAVGVAIGPGSFTGLRIGLGLAKGLCFSRKIPIIGIHTLDILAAAQPKADKDFAVIIEAGRKRLAVGWYRFEDKSESWQFTGKLENLTLDDLVQQIHNPTLVCGELNQIARERLGQNSDNIELVSPAFSLRRPGVLAEIAWKRWQAGDIDDPATLKPIYLHHGEPIPG